LENFLKDLENEEQNFKLEDDEEIEY